jgi:hypothetical protein
MKKELRSLEIRTAVLLMCNKFKLKGIGYELLNRGCCAGFVETIVPVLSANQALSQWLSQPASQPVRLFLTADYSTSRVHIVTC